MESLTVQLAGMDQSIDEGSAADHIENMVWDERGVWRTCPGHSRVGSAPSGEVLSMAWLHRGRTRKLLIEEAVDAATSRLVTLQLPAGTVRVVQSSRPRNRSGCSMVSAGAWLYVFGEDAVPVRWDGVVLERVGFSASPSPPAVYSKSQGFSKVDTLNGTWVSTTLGDYDTVRQRGLGARAVSGADEVSFRRGYAITVLNDLGQESPPSATVFASGENTMQSSTAWQKRGRHLARVVMAAQAENVHGVRLWATTDLGSSQVAQPPLALHSEIPHGAAIDFLDSKTDAELGLELDRSQLGAWPVGAYIAAFWGGRLWLAGMPAAPARLMFSTAGLPEQVPPLNRLDLGGRETGAIRALWATQSALVALCERGVFLVKDSANPRVEIVSMHYGTDSPHAVNEAPGLGVVFLSREGPCVLRGVLENNGTPTEVVLLRGVQKLWQREVNHEGLVKAVASPNPAHQELWFQVPQAGDDRPSLGLVLHYGRQKGWSTRANWPIGAFARRAHELWFGSWSNSNPGIHIVSDGYDEVSGSAINSKYRTGWIKPGQPVRLDTVTVDGLAVGNPALSIRHRIRHEWTNSNPGGLSQTSWYDGDLPKWGSALWSASGEYAELIAERFPHDLDIGRSERFQFELTGGTVAFASVEVLGEADDEDDDK